LVTYGINKEYRLSFTDEAKRIVEGLSLEEKVSLMGGKYSAIEMIANFSGENYNGENHYNFIPYPAGGNEEKGIPQVLFCDGPRGVVCGTGKSTCYPVPMLRGASFDVELEERIGQAIAKEVRAYGGNLFAGICINLPYHPGWGRSQETYGEDSYHIGQMGSAIVRGVQKEHVIPCIKHFAFNSMENARFTVNIECDKRAEREVFLPHFKECIDNGAGAVMTSYNSYQGKHCGQNEYLIRDVLKGEWDFDGFTMTDFIWGINDTIAAANSGQDLEMCNTYYYDSKLIDAVKDGKVLEKNINEAAIRIVRTILAYTRDYDKEYPKDIIGCKEHISLALESAQKGITLLKNENNVLPIDRCQAESIVVLGRLANNENTGDKGSGKVYPPYVISPLQGIAMTAGNKKVVYNDGSDIEHAKTLARKADYVVFVVGYDHDDEGEFVSSEQVGNLMDPMGGDRTGSLGLKPEDIRLINEVGKENPNSVVVLIGGSMIMMEEWKDSVNAILMAYYPGMEGGRAIGQILFGDVNPSGKLPFVIPKDERDLPEINWEADNQRYEYYHGYMKLDKEAKKAAYPYGFGLSYTEFTISNARFEANDNCIEATCDVKNTGNLKGDEVIQFYVGYTKSSIPRPKKALKGFTRVTLEPGQTKTVTIKTPVEQLKWYNEKINGWEMEHMIYDMYLGTSSSSKDLIKGELRL
jgi:beta-glucosidase